MTSTVSHSASVGLPTPFGFYGSASGTKNIVCIKTWFTAAYIQGILITYDDDSTAGPYGLSEPGLEFDIFPVEKGEYITNVFVWVNLQRIVAIRYVKSLGQMSPHFGSRFDPSGAPQLLSGNGSVLVDFSGTADTTGVVQLQANWRKTDEIPAFLPTQTTFAGGQDAGFIFVDLESIGDPYTSRVSRITSRIGGAISGFQVQYTWGGGAFEAETPIRGTDYTPSKVSFQLATDEYIVQVKGRNDGVCIHQLQFITNKGDGPVFGQDIGANIFDFAPPDMRLHYLVGRSRAWVDSLMFVWVPIK
ncbi:hypothetical protein BDV93DRAFT_558584 [Ceratobasidium sp. AG-I]|nr:hypothetical protein BDV93DRAFT_558584 [Ceratobasidium sp. AG-I]